MAGRSSGKESALSGLHVVDLGWLIAAPYVSACLADWGATVVKVESSKRVDPMRSMFPMYKGIAGINRQFQFLDYNTGKYGLGLDLSQPKGIDVARRLISWADVVINNFMPGTMDKLGLGYEELKKTNPGIIMVEASLQGQSGPRAQVGALGIMMQAITGYIYSMGWPDGPPMPSPVATTDFMGAFYCLLAIMGALDHRQSTGEGTYIDISQYEAGVTFIAPAILDYTANGKPQSRMGNHSPHASPHNAYRCKGNDRWCVIAVFGEDEWQSLCRTIGRPELAGDKRFAALARRKENEDVLDRIIGEWTIDRSPEEVMTGLQAAGVAAGVVANGRDLHEDPQLKYRHHFWYPGHSEVGPSLHSGPSYRFARTPLDITMPSPCLGEHTEYVCREILKMSDEEFVSLMADGVLT